MHKLIFVWLRLSKVAMIYMIAMIFMCVYIQYVTYNCDL